MPTLTDLRLAYHKKPETVPEIVEEMKTDEAAEKQNIINEPVKKTKKTKKTKKEKEGE